MRVKRRLEPAGFEQLGKLRKGFATAKAVRPTERERASQKSRTEISDLSRLGTGESNLGEARGLRRPSERARASETIGTIETFVQSGPVERARGSHVIDDKLHHP